MMRTVLLLILLSMICNTKAQKLDKDAVYPVFKPIKGKWSKDDINIMGAPKEPFSECVSGDCQNGEGARLILTRIRFNESQSIFYFTFLKGNFSNNGKNFKGDMYKPEITYLSDNKKTFTPAKAHDLTAADYLSSIYIGKGDVEVWPSSALWHGEAVLKAFDKKFPGATIRNAGFTKDELVWLDMDMPAGHRFTRYTGRVMITGDHISGKAYLPNGDVYEGFFLKNMFMGPGKLTRKNGRSQTGIWYQDSLITAADIPLPSWLSSATLPAKAATTYNFKPMVEDQLQHNPDFYGTVTNEVANGWGMSTYTYSKGPNSGRGIVYGSWKDNKLDGPAIIVTLPQQFDVVHSPGSQEEQYWIRTGIFKEGDMVQGVNYFSRYDTYANQYLGAHDIKHMVPKEIYISVGHFDKGKLQGCGTKLKTYGINDDGSFTGGTLEEGSFAGGDLAGFYFFDDFKRTRSIDKLRFQALYNITEKDVQAAEASDDGCFDALRKLKPQYIAKMKKELAANVAVAETPKKPFDPYAHIEPEKTFTATDADYAKVDGDALGWEKMSRAGYTTRENIKFWETVSADVRKYLDMTYTKNGSRYKKYSRSRYFPGTYLGSGRHEMYISGKTTRFLILYYCERTGTDAKAFVSIEYDGKKLENNKYLSGGKCELVTQCSNKNICKTSCTGAFEFDQHRSGYYYLNMNHTGNWSTAREYWLVLKDEEQ